MDSLDKLYYSISEVSELTEVPTTTLRFWEREFSELSPRRTPKGQRQYTPRDIDTIRTLRFLLKDKGMKIEAARAELKNNRQGVDKTKEVIQRLQGIRSELMKLLKAFNG